MPPRHRRGRSLAGSAAAAEAVQGAAAERAAAAHTPPAAKVLTLDEIRAAKAARAAQAAAAAPAQAHDEPAGAAAPGQREFWGLAVFVVVLAARVYSSAGFGLGGAAVEGCGPGEAATVLCSCLLDAAAFFLIVFSVRLSPSSIPFITDHGAEDVAEAPAAELPAHESELADMFNEEVEIEGLDDALEDEEAAPAAAAAPQQSSAAATDESPRRDRSACGRDGMGRTSSLRPLTCCASNC